MKIYVLLGETFDDEKTPICVSNNPIKVAKAISDIENNDEDISLELEIWRHEEHISTIYDVSEMLFELGTDSVDFARTEA